MCIYICVWYIYIYTVYIYIYIDIWLQCLTNFVHMLDLIMFLHSLLMHLLKHRDASTSWPVSRLVACRGHVEQWLEETKEERYQFGEGLQALSLCKRSQARGPRTSIPSRRQTKDNGYAEEHPEQVFAGWACLSLKSEISMAATVPVQSQIYSF